mgnify:CR=1 FL=1
MAVTTTQIRDLLNRPRGLNEGTISEYLTIRDNQVTKVARSADLFGVTSANAPTTALKDDAVKFLVCLDCLRVLIDTIPAWVPEKEQGTQDIRFNKQLTSFEKQAQSALDEIAERGGTAFVVDSTASRITTSGNSLSGVFSGSE